MPAPDVKYLAVALPLSVVGSPAFAQGVEVGAETSLLPMIALGVLAAAGAAFGALGLRRSAAVENEAADRIAAAEKQTEATGDALEALLFDRADGAAIWAGQSLHVAIGVAEPLTRLETPASPNAVAELFAAPAFEARLAAAITALFQGGVPFEQTVNAPDSGSRRIIGRTLGGRALLSIVEGTGDGRALTADEARLRRADEAQIALSESFDHAPIYAWRRDADSALVWANAAYIEAVEADTLEDAVGKGSELVFGDEASVVLELAERARKTSRPQTIRTATVIGGDRRTLEFREIPVATGTVGFATDVTAQVVGAKALSKQIEANELTLDRLHRGVAVFSKDLTLSYFNDTIATLWGIDGAWLQTNPNLRDVLSALRERSKVPQARNFSTWRAETLDRYSKLTEPHKTDWHLPNGAVMHVLAQPHPLGGLLLVFEDVTDFFELKRDMATVSAVQKAALSRLREGVLVLGLDGKRRLSNAAFEELWGLSEDMLQDVHLREIAMLCEPLYGDQSVWSRMIEFVSGATEARGTWHERLNRSDGSILGMAGTVLPDGATMFAFTDVTDSVNKQQALLEQNEKLEELSGLKSAFLDGIHGASQELKIPLNTIIGFSEIMGQEIFGELNERQREYINGVTTAANDLRLLVSGITDLAMIQADDFPFRVEPIDLKSVIDATVRFIERSVPEPVSLRVDCPDTIGEVPGDGPRFREIMHNLINAVRADTGGDETIEVGVRRVDDCLMMWIGADSVDLTGASWTILEETQHGLDAPALHRDGLGITLVKQFVERQGGTIALERNVGGTKEAVVCRFLTNEIQVRAALSRQRLKTQNGAAADDWDDADSAFRA